MFCYFVECTEPPTEAPTEFTLEQPSEQPICLAASSLVYILENGEQKQIRSDQLQVGDFVLTADDSGELIYDEVRRSVF